MDSRRDALGAGVLTRHDVADALAIDRADVLALLAGRTTPRMYLTDDVFTAPRYGLAPEGHDAELRRALVDAASVLARSTIARMPSGGRIAMRLLLAAPSAPAVPGGGLGDRRQVKVVALCDTRGHCGRRSSERGRRARGTLPRAPPGGPILPHGRGQ